MKKLIVALSLALVFILTVPALATIVTIDDLPTPPPQQTPTPPSPSPTSRSYEHLLKVSVAGVKQDKTDPGEDKTVTLTITFRNGAGVALNNIYAGFDQAASSSLTLIDSFGPFRLNMAAGGTNAIKVKMHVPDTLVGGNYPVPLTLTYSDGLGVIASVGRTFYVLIDRGTGLEGSAQRSEGVPRLILQKYDYGADYVIGGEGFTLDFTVVNTSTTQAAENALFTFGAANSAILPARGWSNQIFVDRIEPGGSYSGRLELESSSATASGLYGIPMNMEYQDGFKSLFDSTATVSIMLSQHQVIAIDEIIMPQSAASGQKVPVSIRYRNAGTVVLKDVVLIIEGNVPEDQKRHELPELAPGRQGYTDFTLTPDGSGDMDISFSIRAVDSRTEESFITPKNTLTLRVGDSLPLTPSAALPSTSPATPGDGSLFSQIPLWAYASAGVLLVVMLGVGIWLWRRRR